MKAPHVGPALPDGSIATVTCEQRGDLVDNGHGSSDIWEHLADGTWLPNAYMNTDSYGWTAGIPECGGTSEGELPKTVPGAPIYNDGDVAGQLLQHYYDKTGADVNIDWSFFADDVHFIDWANQLPSDGTDEIYSSSPVSDGVDFFGALGSFGVGRTSSNCFVVIDQYDFSPASDYFKYWWDAKVGNAKPFGVHASGCLPA